MMRRQVARATRLPRSAVRFADWERETCAACGRDVMFESGQTVNRCGHCGLVIVRGVE